MCTAVSYKTKDHYFGRNLDLEYSYKETVTVTPRNFRLKFRRCGELKNHYAIIGMAYVKDGYPLYYDATNEKGLSIAGLNFPKNAYYGECIDGKDNVAPFEVIAWLLGQCGDISQVKNELSGINIADINYSEELLATPLHWMISDRESSIVLEAVKEGIRIYDNPTGVLTNNPPFDMQMFNLNNYMGLSKEKAENRFSEKLEFDEYSRGMGAMGLPGDLSSMSRFVRAVFTRMNSVSGESEEESVSQFFHILGSVEQQRGCVHTGEGKYEITVYSSCCNTDKGIYYYRTYESSQITGVDMHREDLNSDKLIFYPLITGQQIKMQN